MGDYKKHQEKPLTAGESGALYATRSGNGGKAPVPDSTLMDELMSQSDEVKLLVINKLSESMMHRAEGKRLFTKESPANDAGQQKQLEAKRDYYRQKYKLPEKLIRLIGCIPPHTDEEREMAKEECLKEKYGQP